MVQPPIYSSDIKSKIFGLQSCRVGVTTGNGKLIKVLGTIKYIKTYIKILSLGHGKDYRYV